MQNFKSYQGNVTIGPLYHKFNAIVGPNGSGKSNLMESLLFVFGKRAKSMRLKKLTDLIHKSTNFPDIKYARVSVYFKEIRDKDDGTYEEISKELVITREINKASGNSKYYLDKHEITHDGLCNRLEEYGIDLKHNRFLILQGEVEQISMLANKAKPGSKEGGLLEFLEDIIGTNRYVNMINHLSKDTEDILDIKIAKEKRVKLCKGDVNKMEESKNVCIEYFKEEKSLFYLLYLEGKISTLEIKTELKAFEEKVKLKEEKKKLKIKEMEELKSKNDKILQELNEKKLEQKKIEKLRIKEEGKLNSLEDEDKIKRAELDNLEKAIKKEENSKKIIMKNYDELNENFQNAKNQLPVVVEELNKIKSLLTKDEEQLKKQEKEAYEKTSSLQKEKQEIEKALSPYLNEIQVAEFEISQKEKLLNMDSIYIQLKESLSLHQDKYKHINA